MRICISKWKGLFLLMHPNAKGVINLGKRRSIIVSKSCKRVIRQIWFCLCNQLIWIVWRNTSNLRSQSFMSWCFRWKDRRMKSLTRNMSLLFLSVCNPAEIDGEEVITRSYPIKSIEESLCCGERRNGGEFEGCSRLWKGCKRSFAEDINR